MDPKRTILVVDDIPLMRTILTKYIKSVGLRILAEELGGGGVEVIEAANGAAAMQKLQEREVDLIFLDLMMPEMDGLTFLEKKRANPDICAIPVIVCSALGERETVDRARALGAVSYIVKPFTLNSVEEKFREVLSVFQQ